MQLVCEPTEGHVLHKTTAHPAGIELGPVLQWHLPPPPGSRISQRRFPYPRLVNAERGHDEPVPDAPVHPKNQVRRFPRVLRPAVLEFPDLPPALGVLDRVLVGRSCRIELPTPIRQQITGSEVGEKRTACSTADLRERHRVETNGGPGQEARRVARTAVRFRVRG